MTIWISFGSIPDRLVNLLVIAGVELGQFAAQVPVYGYGGNNLLKISSLAVFTDDLAVPGAVHHQHAGDLLALGASEFIDRHIDDIQGSSGGRRGEESL